MKGVHNSLVNRDLAGSGGFSDFIFLFCWSLVSIISCLFWPPPSGFYASFFFFGRGVGGD